MEMLGDTLVYPSSQLYSGLLVDPNSEGQFKVIQYVCIKVSENYFIKNRCRFNVSIHSVVLLFCVSVT